jgi:hypothetical protein
MAELSLLAGRGDGERSGRGGRQRNDAARPVDLVEHNPPWGVQRTKRRRLPQATAIDLASNGSFNTTIPAPPTPVTPLAVTTAG